jgi:hypothetical protein
LFDFAFPYSFVGGLHFGQVGPREALILAAWAAATSTACPHSPPQPHPGDALRASPGHAAEQHQAPQAGNAPARSVHVECCGKSPLFRDMSVVLLRTNESMIRDDAPTVPPQVCDYYLQDFLCFGYRFPPGCEPPPPQAKPSGRWLLNVP